MVDRLSVTDPPPKPRRRRDHVEFEVVCTFCDTRGRKVCTSCRKTLLIGLGVGYALGATGKVAWPFIWQLLQSIA